MVYVFFVQPGEMMTFDHQISIMQSVKHLKEKIQQTCGIPLDQQVLLINGGESLDPNKNLCSYMAGTDTNPIYLFSTNYDVTKLEILANLTFDDNDLRRRLKECSDLPASLKTVTTRAQLAQDYLEVAKKQLNFCEGLVHDQHLQQQGWCAVIANLEDIVSEFKKRWELFLTMYNEFIMNKDNFAIFLQNYVEDKNKLQKIPVLEVLLETQKQNVASLDTSSALEEEKCTPQDTESESCSGKLTNLFDWISASDSKTSLDELHEICEINLQKFDYEVMPCLRKQIEDTLFSADRSDAKEIEGLGRRLFDLEELLVKMKKYVQHQSDMAQSFLQNQQRASNLRDQSILPDLCATHQQQLDYIKDHHRKLMEDRSRIIKAKFELCKSLCARIRWVQNVEEKLWELDHLLVYYHEHLSRLRKHLEVFHQLHMAPVIYTSAVAEVVRRRTFSQLFLLWASEVACHQLTIHNEEVTRRKEFSAQFEGHFLNALFPGMNDLPPAFATEAPSMFDARLPKITVEDVEKLRKELKELPEFLDNLSVPDLTSYTSFFATTKSSMNIEKDRPDDTNAIEEKLMKAVSDVGLASNLDQNLLAGVGVEAPIAVHGLPHLKDIDRGCESETDTEEFEKVGQSPLELNFAKDAIPPVQQPTQDASTTTEDNLQVSRSEHDKLKSFLLSMSDLARQVATQLREEVGVLKMQVLSDKNELNGQFGNYTSAWNNFMSGLENEREKLIEELKNDHSKEVARLEQLEIERSGKIKSLEIHKNELETKIQESLDEIKLLSDRIKSLEEQTRQQDEELKKIIQEKDSEKEKAVKEISDNLKLEHKAEIESIKSRLKLMTMERSLSSSSLEKSSDFASLPSHTSLFIQMTENFELDKEKAVKEAQEAEKLKYDQIIKETVKNLEDKFREEKEFLIQSVTKRVSEDRDKQIEVLRDREKKLSLECVKYKTTLQQLTEKEMESSSADLHNKYIDLVEKHEVLKAELENLKKRKEDVNTKLSSSIALHEGSVDSSTSSYTIKSGMARNETANQQPTMINITSCRKGDLVLVVWDSVRENYRIAQEHTSREFFLHTDYLEGLGLSVTDGKPNKLYCVGEVIDREYCCAKRSKNRYNVPKDIKFFQVKVRPTTALPTRDSTMNLCHLKQTSTAVPQMSQSHTIATTCETISEESASSMYASPTSTLPSTSGSYPFVPESSVVEHQPECVVEKSSTENVEQATIAMEQLNESVDTIENDSSSCDIERYSEGSEKGQQHAYISSNWLETMLRSIFSKSIEN